LNQKKFRGSLRRKLLFIILFVTLSTGLMGYIGFVYWYVSNQHAQIEELSKTLGSVVGQNIAKIVLLDDVSAAAEVTSQLKSFDKLEKLVLYKLDSTPIFRFSKDGNSFEVPPLPKDFDRTVHDENGFFHLYTDAVYQNTPLGYISYTFKGVSTLDVVKKDAFALVIILLVMYLISFLLATYYSQSFTKPILKLVHFLEKIDIKVLHNRIYTKEQNEYGILYDKVNIMLDKIEESHKNLQIAAAAFNTQSGMAITDTSNTILQVNDAFCKITGYTKEEVIGKTPSILKSGYHNTDFYRHMFESLKKYGYWQGEVKNRKKDGSIVEENLLIQTVLDEEKKLQYYVSSFLDITLQKKIERKLRYLEQYDPVTGLANRTLFLQKLTKYYAKHKKDGYSGIVIFDIKDFKLLNNAFSREVGDIILQKITNLLEEKIPECIMFAKIENTFALCLPLSDKNIQDAAVSLKLQAQYIYNLLHQGFKVDSQNVNFISNIGISVFENGDKDIQKVLLEAENALIFSKQNALNISFFDKNMQLSLVHFNRYSEMLKALTQKQFELYYQMQYHNNEIYGAEALIRWNHPKEGLIPPNDFIPVAEKSGLIISMGEWIIQTACKQLAQWHQNDETSQWTLSINVSAKQFNDENFMDYIAKALLDNNIQKGLLKVELTESILVDNLDNVNIKIHQLKELGVRVSLDDFGTGYSSLSYLKYLDFDQVKIDQSFVFSMLESQSDIAIIKSIILIAESMNIEVIAEGVENEKHVALLQELGCNHFQGYYFAKPLPIGEIPFS